MWETNFAQAALAIEAVEVVDEVVAEVPAVVPQEEAEERLEAAAVVEEVVALARKEEQRQLSYV